MVAGLEILRYKPCIQRQKMFYWEKKGNSVAEIDYLEIHDMQIMPIENARWNEELMEVSA